MSRLRETFGRSRVILPVIHVANEEQALQNARIASQAGADGIFLINHSRSYGHLLAIARQVISNYPTWWVGVNCLDLEPEEVLGVVPNEIKGVWVDNAKIRENAKHQPEAERVQELRRQRQWSGLYFGGVAFKYQRHVDDLTAAAAVASKYMDVVTTSGPGTGMAASPEKIRTMKQALGEFPLAIASGITPDNIDDYLPYADCFLVATGISHTFEELDAKLVDRLVAQVHSHQG